MSELTLETLLDHARITDVLNRYASALDQRHWSALDQVFTADAIAHYEGLGEFHGLAAITELVSSVLLRCAASQHLLGNISISVEGDSARAHCYLQGIHTGLGSYEGACYTVWGEYRDQLVRGPQGWRIVHRTLSGIHAQGDIGLTPD